MEDGKQMLACAFANPTLALCTAIMAARIGSSLHSRIKSLLFQIIGDFLREDVDGFSAASLITLSTNDVYQIQQFLPRVITIVVKVMLLRVWTVFKISGGAFEWTSVTVAVILFTLTAFAVILHRGMPFIRRMQWYGHCELHHL